MKQISKAAILTLLVMLTFGVANATATVPLFLTESKKALLFTVDGGTTTLRGENAGIEGNLKCEKYNAHGFILDKSSLVRELHIEISGKCVPEAGFKGPCTEPLILNLSYGELGLLNGHVYLLIAPATGTEFIEFTCTNANTELRGAVAGEFPLNAGSGVGLQYRVDRKDFLLLYRAKGTTQEPEEIELLGILMKAVTLQFEGLFSGKASLESTQLLLVDGQALIDP